MGLSCRVPVETAEGESTEAQVQTWHERKGGTVFTEAMNGSEDEEDESEAKPGSDEVRNGVCGDGGVVAGATVVIVGCPSEPDAVERAADILSWKNDIERLSEGRLLAVYRLGSWRSHV